MKPKYPDPVKWKSFLFFKLGTMISRIIAILIPSIVFYIANSSACAAEFRFINTQGENESGLNRRLAIKLPLELVNNDNDQRKKWNPAVKYTAVILTAGVGAFLIFNAFSPVLGRGECDESKISESPCIESPAVGGVIGGLILFVVATGIAVDF